MIVPDRNTTPRANPQDRRSEERLRRELSGPPIPDGSRNATLTRVAGALHDGFRTLEELAEDLHAVNKVRCEHDAYGQQLSRREVGWIAKSIHRRPPCKPSKGKPPDEVLDFVRRHWLGVLEARPWTGRGGGSEHKTYAALLEVAESHGWRSKAGNVCVSVSVRQLAELAGVSTKTCHAALKRLQKANLIYRVPMVTNSTAGTLALREVAASPQGVNSQSTPVISSLTVHLLSKILRRFRHGAGKITPVRALHVQALALLGGAASVTEVADKLGRRSDNVRRAFESLEQRGLVEPFGEDRYCLPFDIFAALSRALDEDGVEASEKAQRRRNENEREAYRQYVGESREERMESIAAECGADEREQPREPNRAPDEEELNSAGF